MIYLDNSASSFPKPQSVAQEAYRAITLYGANPGRSSHELGKKADRIVFECRKAVALLFNSTPENVVFTLNATHALNIAILGSITPNCHVIISDLEHNSVYRPVKNSGVDYSVLNVDSLNPNLTLKRLEKLIKPNTKIIAMTLCSNLTGEILPFFEIGRLAKRKGIIFIADASQCAGSVDIDVVRDNINILCAPGHKGLLGLQGSGIMILNGALPKPLMWGGTGSMSVKPNMPENPPERYEAGTLNTPAIAGLLRGVEYIRNIGVKNIGNYEKSLALTLYDELKNNKKIKFLCPVQSGIIAFTVDGMTSESVCEKLNEGGFCVRGGLHCSPLAHEKYGTLSEGAVRVSFGCFNTYEQAKKLASFIKKFI